MKRLVILGAGTAGTTVANKLRRRLPLDEWRITVVDRDGKHLYQFPGKPAKKMAYVAGLPKPRGCV
jgi:NADH dehydrogenase FAD-containing subunit